MGLESTKHVDQDNLGPHMSSVLLVVLENRGASTVGKCSKNSRGEKARSMKNSKSKGEQSEQGTGKHTRDEGRTTG